MATFYEVWDDSTGNRLGEFETLAEAKALLHDVLRAGGPDTVRTLSVLEYAPSDAQDFEVTTVLEGSDFLGGLPGSARAF